MITKVSMLLIFLQAFPPMASPVLPPLPASLATDTWLALLGVMVALASLVLTGVAVMVGVLAIFGYGTFKDEVRARASEAAKTAADVYFKEAAFQDTLKGAIKDLQAETAAPEPGPQGTVGDTYPD
jgi:hypothetical protein